MCEHSLASKGICVERHVLEDGRMRAWRYPRCGPCPRDRLEVSWHYKLCCFSNRGPQG